jgi:hypothetical protein
MALSKPVAVDALPPVTRKAEALAAHLANIDLTKFLTKLRFGTGCALVAVSIAVFFLGHSLFVNQYFTPDFADRSWHLTIILLILGAAFAGKEVVDGLGAGLKSLGLGK